MMTSELRKTFLLGRLFRNGQIETRDVDLDGTVIGGEVPTTRTLALETHPELRADYSLKRRELGVLNVGGSGTVTVDRQEAALGKLDLNAVTIAGLNL